MYALSCFPLPWFWRLVWVLFKKLNETGIHLHPEEEAVQKPVNLENKSLNSILLSSEKTQCSSCKSLS